ncbi:MAG: YraN family protein [Woeseiaceae bacterium]
MARVDTRTVGFDAERIAGQYLKQRGIVPVTQNFRCRLGEIDLVARDGRCLVFVEVRFRGPGSFSRAGLTVDIHKQRKLIRTAALYVSKRSQYANSVMRFDVVAIDANENGEVTIDWIKDAFRPGDSRL